MAGRLQQARGLLTSISGTVQFRVVASCALWTEDPLGVAAVKGWWYSGADQGYEDLRGHGGTHLYRRRAFAEIGRLRRGAGMIWVLCTVDAGRRIDAMRVWKCGCKDLGEDRWLCMVLLSRDASLSIMAQDCVGMVEVTTAGVLRCMQRLRIVCGGLCTGMCT